MKNALIPIPYLAFLSLTVTTLAQEAPTQSDSPSGYYKFQSVEVLTSHKSKIVPVVSADKKGMYVTKGKGLKRIRWSAPCMVQPSISLSKEFIKIDDFKHNFFYQKSGHFEERAYDEMQQKDREISNKIAQMTTVGDSSANSEAIAALEDERDEFEDQMETLIQNDDLLLEGHADSIRLSMTLTSTTDIKDAYCVIMVPYNRQDGKRRLAAKLHWIGELLQDIPEPISLSLFLSEGNYSKSKAEVCLFSGDGKPHPSSLSRSLQMLSNAELKEMLP